MIFLQEIKHNNSIIHVGRTHHRAKVNCKQTAAQFEQKFVINTRADTHISDSMHSYMRPQEPISGSSAARRGETQQRSTRIPDGRQKWMSLLNGLENVQVNFMEIGIMIQNNNTRICEENLSTY